MNLIFKYALGLFALNVAAQAAAQITFYEGEGFRGRMFTTDQQVGNFERFGFNDRASSVVVDRGRWEVCDEARFAGRCAILRPGRYDSLNEMGMNNRISSVRPVEERARYGNEAPAPVAAQEAMPITFYESEGFRGRTFTTDRQVGNLERFGFNDRASSIIVERGRWEVCDEARFAGRCAILRPGRYDSLSRMGMNDRISSLRPVDERARYENEAPAPRAAANFDNRALNSTVGTVERIEILNKSDPNNIAGTVIGGIVGGLIGHQIGGGTGQTIATIGGAVGGALAGNQIEQRRRAPNESFRVTVRMDSGTYQTITEDNIADLKPGDRVRVDGNAISRY